MVITLYIHIIYIYIYIERERDPCGRRLRLYLYLCPYLYLLPDFLLALNVTCYLLPRPISAPVPIFCTSVMSSRAMAYHIISYYALPKVYYIISD